MESVDVSMSVFFVKQKTAYEMRISDWSSDVCASDLGSRRAGSPPRAGRRVAGAAGRPPPAPAPGPSGTATSRPARSASGRRWCRATGPGAPCAGGRRGRSEEHTSELQSLMRISYAVFRLKKKNRHTQLQMYTMHDELTDDRQTL